MANNPYVNKVQYGSTTLIDLTADTVTADKLMQGYTAHDRTGAVITGTASEGSNIDIPTFDVVWDSSYSTRTITCDKTFAECYAKYANTETGAYVHTYVNDPNDDWEQFEVATAVDAVGSEYIAYVINGVYGPVMDIMYHSNGTITIVEPSAYSTTLNVTQNGEYWPTKGVYMNAIVNVSGSSPTLQNKTVTPTTSQQTVQADSGYDGLGTVTVNAMPTGTAGTPSASKGAVSNHSIAVTPSVTNATGYITGGTKTGTAVTVSASELVSGTLSITSSGTKDVTNYASASISAGTAGTPTASKGTVSNHSVSITPSVTNSAGYITGSTKTGTAVTVSASELVSGTLSVIENGTKDVTNYANVNVSIPFVTYYTGSTNPASSLGSNGDIYLKVVS